MRRSLLVLLALLVTGPALAQGIGSVAAREKQKRETAGQREKPRVLTNDDLKGEEGKTAAPAPEAAAAPAVPSERQDPDSREQGEAPAQPNPLDQAQAQVDAARAAVVAAEERVKELGDKLNPMSPSFIYGAAQSGDAAGEEIRTRQALGEAEAQLAQARDGLVKANQAYERVRQGQPARPREDR